MAHMVIMITIRRTKMAIPRVTIPPMVLEEFWVFSEGVMLTPMELA